MSRDVDPLTSKEELTWRLALADKSSPTLDVEQSTGIAYATAEWADRCRRLFATLDRERADVVRLALVHRFGQNNVDAWSKEGIAEKGTT